MPLPSIPPALIIECPLRDTTHARLAGDSAGRRVSVSGYATLGGVTGAVTGVSGLVVAANKTPTTVGVFLASLAGATANTIVASGDKKLTARDQERLVGCDSTLKQVYRDAFGERAKAKRGKWAFFSTLLSAIFSAAVVIGLLFVALAGGNFT